MDDIVAQQSIDARVVDLEMLRQISSGTDVSFGLRYASIDQRYAAAIDDGDALVDADMNFDGFGPTIGIDTRYSLGRLCSPLTSCPGNSPVCSPAHITSIPPTKVRS